MSLIPSESYSFPDLEEGARRKKPKREILPENVAPAETNVELPPEVITDKTFERPIENTEVQTAKPAPVKPPVSPPAVQIKPTPPKTVNSASVLVPKTPPPRPVKPAVAPAIAPPRTVTAKAADVLPAVPPRRIKPVVPNIPVVPDQLGGLTQPGARRRGPNFKLVEVAEEKVEEAEAAITDYEAHHGHKHRGRKLVRFLVLEVLAVGALLVFAKLEVNERFSGNSLTYLYGTAMLISALAAAVIPVIFYALPPTLPSGRQ